MHDHVIVPEKGLWIPNVEIEMWRGDDLLDVVKIKNAHTSGLNNAVVDQMLAAPTLGKPTHLATGTGAPAANALGAEIARVALGTKTRSANVLTMSGDLPPGTATATLTEFGIFDAGAAGNLFFYATSAGLVKDASMDLVVNWTYTLT